MLREELNLLDLLRSYSQVRSGSVKPATSLVGTSVYPTAHISTARSPLYLLLILLVLVYLYPYDLLYAGPWKYRNNRTKLHDELLAINQ